MPVHYPQLDHGPFLPHDSEASLSITTIRFRGLSIDSEQQCKPLYHMQPLTFLHLSKIIIKP